MSNRVFGFVCMSKQRDSLVFIYDSSIEEGREGRCVISGGTMCGDRLKLSSILLMWSSEVRWHTLYSLAIMRWLNGFLRLTYIFKSYDVMALSWRYQKRRRKKRIETIYFSSIERTTKNKTLIDPVTHMLFARVALNNVAKLFYFYVYTQRRTCINNQ